MMNIINRSGALTLVFMLIPLLLFSFDLFGNVTFRGKVVDADTLKPIEGAVVVAEWEKCHPGLGEGHLCSFKMVKEALTDKNGEWSIYGPKGESSPSMARILFGYIVSVTAPPRFQIYKPGYCRLHQKPGWFQAYPYVNKEKNLEGIVLIRMGDTNDEKIKFLKEYTDRHVVPFVSIKDPEKKLHELNFDFRYPPDVKRIEDVWEVTMYDVMGLKKAKTQEEMRKALLSPTTVDHWIYLPSLRKVVENSIK
jgi:hypothetical protein